MMNQEQLLWRLQELKQAEAALLKNEELRPLIKNLKELQQNVKRGEEEIQSLLDKIENGNKKAVKLEKDTDMLAKQVEESKGKLYGVKGGSLKELLSLQQSVLKLEAQGKEIETLYWDNLKAIEEYKNEKERLKGKLKVIKKEYNEGVKEYKEIKVQFEWKLSEIKNKEEEVLEQLLPEVVRLYEEAEKRHPLNFIAKLQKDTCSGCRISVPSLLAKEIKAGKGFYHCDNCGRILINSF